MARRDDDDDDDDKPAKPKSKANIYTGLTVITFLGLVTAAVILYLDFDERNQPDKKLAEPKISMSALIKPAGKL